MQHLIPFIWLIILSVSLCATVFGIYYLTSKENMALIERGINPRTHKTLKFPGMTLKMASFLVGAGAGLFLAYILNVTVFHEDPVAIYFGLIAVGAGLGLFTAYNTEMKWLKKQGEKVTED